MDLDQREQGVEVIDLSRAVSEVLGYILVLAVVVTTITVIYAAGMPAIRSQQDVASFRSMENTFYVLQNIVRLVAYNITPEKAVTIRAEGGSIVVVPDWGRITVYISSNPSKPIVNETYGAIVYVGTNGKGLILDNAVILQAYGNKIMPSPANSIQVDSRSLIYSRIFREGNNIYISLIRICEKPNEAVSFSGQKILIFKNVGSKIISNTSVNWVRIRVKIKKASNFGWSNDQLMELWLNSIEYSLNGSIKKWKKSTDWVYINPKGGNNLNVTIAIYNVTVSR